MTRTRVPGPAGPIRPRGPISEPKPPTPIVDVDRSAPAPHELVASTRESARQGPLPPPRIDLATMRPLPDLLEPVRPLPPPRIDLATMRPLPDLPESVRPLPPPRIDLATMRPLPDLPEPVRPLPLPLPRIDLATMRPLPDLPEPVRPLPPPRIDLATMRPLPDLPEPVRPLPPPRIDLATMRPLPDLPEPESNVTAVQLQAAPGGAANLTASAVHAAAAAGIRDRGQPLPHFERIQRAFGPDHDVSQVTAHVGGAATAAAAQLGATAYAAGEHIAFAGEPDLRLASHEAAHVVQQRSGVHLQGGIDQPCDAFEHHADAVANAVVDGKAAAALLDQLPDGGAHRHSTQRTSDTSFRTIQRTPAAGSNAARSGGAGSPQISSIGRQPAADEQRELLVAQVESLRIEAGGTPSIARYSDLLAAVLAAQRLTARLTDRHPDDPAVTARVTQLLQPVAQRLDRLNDHQGRLRQFGAGNLAGQVTLDMAQAAIESWLRRLKLGASIHTDELVTKFRASAETVRFLTGERTDAPTLRAFNTASRVTALGAAGLALAPVMLAVAAEAAPLLVVDAATVATRRVVLWALHNPAAALAASEALLGLGLQLGEDGLGTFWDLLHDPTGRWFILAQVLMDYVHVRSGMHGGGTTAPTPRRSSVPTGTELPPPPAPTQATTAPLPDLGSGTATQVAGARERVARLRAIVQRVHDGASATHETDQASVPRSPLHSNEEHAPIAIATEPRGAARGSPTQEGAPEPVVSIARIPEDSHARLAAAASRAGISVRSLSAQQQKLLSSADSLIAKGDIHDAIKLFDQFSNSGVPREVAAKLESEIATLHNRTPPGVYRQPRAILPNGKIIEPSAYGGRLFYGTDDTPEIVFEQGFSARGPKTDLLSHVQQDPDSAFRGTTRQIFEPRSPGEDQAGAGAWAGEGGYVYEIDGTPSWDLNAQLAGRVSRPDGSFGGNPLYGEHEYAILANVPRQRIVGAYPIRMQNGRLVPGPLIRNTHYEPIK